MKYDVIIIGGGPAGVSAGIYSSRKQLKTLVISESFGGQSAVSSTVENWIGEISIPGWQLGQKFEAHLRAQEGIEVRQERATKIEPGEKGYVVTTEGGAYETKTVILAMGGKHRHLGVPGEEEFKGKGVVYCSTCDAPFFKGKMVAVVGGGNSGLEAVEDLLPYATSVTLLALGDTLKGDEVTKAKILADSRVSVVYHAKTVAVLGETKVTGIRYEDMVTGETKDLSVDGVFVEIGMVPNSDLVKGLVDITDYGEVKVDARSFAASLPGVFAAGDITDTPYRQNNISAGQGVVAALSAYDHIRKGK
jgi:alkyl hydroperoxide reductase subunit F